MKVIVACGGTGGHAFPGLAVAAELSARGHEVVVWDSGRDIESSVMREWPGPVFSTGARQLSPKNAFHILGSMLRCRREMKRNRPDVLIAMGSYSSLPPVLAAGSCGVRVWSGGCLPSASGAGSGSGSDVSCSGAVPERSVVGRIVMCSVA